MIDIILLVVCCYSSTVLAMNYDEPIAPKDWQALAGSGFATNYFKSISYKKINDQNFQDVYDKGFRNLRLRCRTDTDPTKHRNALVGFDMKEFLVQLNRVVDKMLEVGLVPIICWENHHAEAYASEQDKKDFVKWWGDVAESLKDKDYRLTFNLFTELGIDVCQKNCKASLNRDMKKYTSWTKEAIKRIREAGGKNDKRIIILGAPQKIGASLYNISADIYKDDPYMMAEWHLYASGPNHKILTKGGIPVEKGGIQTKVSQKYWTGNGEKCGQHMVDKSFVEARKWTKKTGIETYFGAWMPQDNEFGLITQREAEAFSKYFVQALRREGLPWSLNALDLYYVTRSATWKKGKQEILGPHPHPPYFLNMEKILEAMIEARDGELMEKKTEDKCPKFEAYKNKNKKKKKNEKKTRDQYFHDEIDNIMATFDRINDILKDMID